MSRIKIIPRVGQSELMEALQLLDDQALMLRYGEGDSVAFDVLYERHRQGLYRYFLRQCSHSSLAEDLYQDVWSKVIGAAQRYRPEAAFSTWLYRIAHHRLVDYYRKPVMAQEDEAESVLDDSAAPERLTEQYQQAQLLRQCLQQLPSPQLEAFMLKEEIGFTVAGTAEVVGASVEATKSRLRYAYGKLRDCVTSKWQEVRHERT